VEQGLIVGSLHGGTVQRIDFGSARRRSPKYPVPGLVPGTHVFSLNSPVSQDVDGRDKPGHGAVFVVAAEQIMYDLDMSGWVYMMANQRNGTLYFGSAVYLARRAWEHREGVCDGFTKQYGLKRLVYFEQYDDIRAAR
jgi:hypothetical protein